MAQKHILIICGESSGDLHAANLAKAIKEIAPEFRISGIGGTLLAQSGVNIYFDIKDLSVMGLFDVLKKLPKFFALKKFILHKISEEKPDLIILVDFSGFNLRLAKAIRNKIPIIYYISPQVWASRPGRIKTLKKYISKIIVIFKFEEEFYKKYGVDASFLGNPLLDIVKPSISKDEFLASCGLAKDKISVTLLPGSRKQEVERILPVMFKSAEIIQKNIKNVQFIVAKSPQVDWGLYNKKLPGASIDLKIVENKAYDCINASDFCLVASGTATLEVAIMQKPFLIIYKASLLNYLLYLPQVKVPFIGIVNILSNKKIIPEFIQFKATPERIACEALRLLKDPSAIEQIKENLTRIKSSLGESGAAGRSAQYIINFLTK